MSSHVVDGADDCVRVCLIRSTSPRAGRPRHTANGALRDLFDDSYLPTPKELLEHCRNGSPRRQPASAVGS